MLASVGKYLLVKFGTEIFIKRVCIACLKHLAAQSTNTLDDEIVAAVQEALK